MKGRERMRSVYGLLSLLILIRGRQDPPVVQFFAASAAAFADTFTGVLAPLSVEAESTTAIGWKMVSCMREEVPALTVGVRMLSSRAYIRYLDESRRDGRWQMADGRWKSADGGRGEGGGRDQHLL